jgi:hypothetical protein
MLCKNEGKRADYFIKLISDKKLEFYTNVMKIGKYFEQCQRDGISVPYDENLKSILHDGSQHVIENAFGPEFFIPYRAALQSNCPKDGTLDEPLKLLREFKFERQFFMYLLDNIFYGKYPQWNNYHLKIRLHSIFERKERTVYVLKKWFQDANELKINMTYPVTCFSDQGRGVPKKPFVKSYMMPIVGVSPMISECDKAMVADVSLANKFMVFFAHDAKLCVGTYVPSSLYTLNSNAYFIGKAILNNNYYNKETKSYVNKMVYSISDMFDFLNLPEKDVNNGNNSHRRKSIFKALTQLDNMHIIKIDKLNSERVKLNYVWNIQDTLEDKYPEDSFNE